MASRKCTNVYIPEYFMVVRKCINIYVSKYFCAFRGFLYGLVAWNEPVIHVVIHFATV